MNAFAAETTPRLNGRETKLVSTFGFLGSKITRRDAARDIPSFSSVSRFSSPALGISEF
jgi:hypothetical protein